MDDAISWNIIALWMFRMIFLCFGVYRFLKSKLKVLFQNKHAQVQIKQNARVVSNHGRGLFKVLIMDRCVMSTTNTYPWFIPIISWCRQFPSISTNIVLIKSKWKLESNTFAVGVAMSPRNLGGKYRCHPHPRSRKCTRQVFAEAERIKSNYTRATSSLDDRDNVVDHVVCLKAEFLWHTVLSNANGNFYTYGIYVYP